MTHDDLVFRAERWLKSLGCGVVFRDERENLPIFLQNYKMKGYNGNSLLDRLDPVDEEVIDPWSSLKLGVILPLSKRMFNRLRKESGLEKVTDLSKFFDKK